ncbi:MAG TPA: hypothetical protein VI912_04445 [Candidatus Bilamarchaeaceae archaeon]|nr:hypothetical protein [Candidatus Bilamarchaeaceae archaeon]
MVNLTLSVPDSLYKKIKEHNEINWSELARRAFEGYLAKIEITENLTKESKLTSEDAIEIGELIKKSMWKRYLSESK